MFGLQYGRVGSMLRGTRQIWPVLVSVGASTPPQCKWSEIAIPGESKRPEPSFLGSSRDAKKPTMSRCRESPP
eukprot:6146966-Alexandrium_andersonii.AAC.1